MLHALLTILQIVENVIATPVFKVMATFASHYPVMNTLIAIQTVVVSTVRRDHTNVNVIRDL